MAAAVAAVAQSGDRIALIGPLGAGKTQFAKGFARGLGVTEVVNSPSFTLMAEYAGRLPLFHQDLYRLSGAEEAMAGGLVDERQLDGVTVSEWGDRLPSEIDPRRITRKSTDAMKEFVRSIRNQLSCEATGSLTSGGPAGRPADMAPPAAAADFEVSAAETARIS